MILASPLPYPSLALSILFVILWIEYLHSIHSLQCPLRTMLWFGILIFQHACKVSPTLI